MKRRKRGGILKRMSTFFRRGASYGPGHDYYYGNFVGPTKAGVPVDEYIALNFSAVYNAITIISQTIGSLPLHLYKRTKRITQKVVNRPGYGVLHSVANPEMTAMTYRETTSAHELSWGNSYSFIVRNGMGQIVELWPITPNRVKPYRENGQLIYEIDIDKGEKKDFSRDQILHIPGLGFDGLTGYSVLTKARESIALGMATEEFGARFFGQGTNPAGVLEMEDDLGDGYEDFLKKFKAGFEGLGKSHKVMILEHGLKYKPLGVKPEDAQFLQTRAFTVVEIARWFNIEPMKLKDHSKSSFDNISSLQISHVIDCIRPWLVRREQNYNMQLLSPEERRRGYYYEHVIEGLLRGDWQARGEFYTKMFNVGAFSPNDILEKENMNPGGPEGDERFVPMNMMPLSMARKMIEMQDEPDDEPEPSDDDSEPPTDEENNREFWKAISQKAKQIEYKEGIATRSIKGRERISKRYYPLIKAAAKRIVNKEGNAVKNQTKKQRSQRAEASMEKWLNSFYRKMPDYIIQELGPVFRSFSEAIIEESAVEIGVEPDPKDMDQFINDYIDRYAERHVESSRGQLVSILNKPDEEKKDKTETVERREWADDIDDRVDEWSE
ncbi:MAG TPA: phage portal protein, partial [Desulfobacterales bacterium]|nr:phage portal protein [Desulfobacterales bacterium]